MATNEQHDAPPHGQARSRGAQYTMSARPGFRGDASFKTRNDGRIEQLRVPPQSIEAEQAVLGGLMLDPSAFDRIADQLSDELAGALARVERELDVAELFTTRRARDPARRRPSSTGRCRSAAGSRSRSIRPPIRMPRRCSPTPSSAA